VWALLLAFAASAPVVPQFQPPATPQLRWYKGNTHTHTLNSDGDSTPDDVVRWYRENGYNFLVLTDHTSTDAILEALERGDFYASTGVELTDYQANDSEIRITVKQQGSSKYRVQFKGLPPLFDWLPELTKRNSATYSR
jgi:hypothetical protein